MRLEILSAPGYSVDDLGNVYGKSGSVMKPATRKDGYQQLALRVGGKYSTRLVHRLVAEAFLGESILPVNHLDGVKSNNAADNLDYCTHSENNYHCSQVLRKKIKPVQLTRGMVSYWWPSQYECAEDTGLPFNSVSALHTGVRRMAKGWNSTHFEERE